jgi:hypothetical protein
VRIVYVYGYAKGTKTMTDIKQWDEVNEESSTVSVADLDFAVREYKALRDVYDEKKKESNIAHEQMEASKATLMTLLSQAGKERYYVEDVGTVSVSKRMVVRMPRDLENKAKLIDYLRQKGIDLEFLTVNHNSLNSWYNEEARALAARGLDPVVPGITEVESMEVLSVRKNR